MGLLVLGAVHLLLEHIALEAVPATRPGLVGPAQRKREVRLPRREHLLEGTLQEARAPEPGGVPAEPMDAVGPGQLGLGRADVRIPEVVIAELAGDAWLLMPREHRLRTAHVVPVGEPLTPPLVVLGD